MEMENVDLPSQERDGEVGRARGSSSGLGEGAVSLVAERRVNDVWLILAGVVCVVCVVRWDDSAVQCKRELGDWVSGVLSAGVLPI
jgi:hypothetical protein